MPSFRRPIAFSFACTLVACHPSTKGPETPEQGSTPIAETEGGVKLAIVPVPQTTASQTGEWVFDPAGGRIASSELGNCSIWDVATGRLILDDDADPSRSAACTDWPSGTYLLEFQRELSADEKLESDGDSILDAASGKVLRPLACKTCVDADAMTWSASGHQLAYLWTEPLRLEVFDGDTGKRLREESIDPVGRLEDYDLGWTKAGLVLVLSELGEPVDCEEYDDCEEDEEGNYVHEPLFRRLLLSTSEGLIETDLGIDAGGVEEIGFDPSGEWVYWTREWTERRGGTTTEANFVGVDGRPSGLSSSVETDDAYEDSMSREGQWRSDGATHWAVKITNEGYDGFNGMEWETTLTSPPLGRRRGPIELGDYGWEVDATIELFGFVKDALRFAGEMCSAEDCKRIGPSLPPDCTLLDIGSNHATELIDCGARLHLRSEGGKSMLPLPLDADSAFWWWTSAGALAIHDGATFMVLDAVSGRVGLQRSDVGDVLEGKVGLELGRLVLATDHGYEVLDLTSLKVAMGLPDVDPVDLAFASTGDRVALLESDEVRVLAYPSGETIASWPAPGGSELAFRQDGQAVFVGEGMPLRGFDAKTGEPLNDPLLFARIAEAIDGGGEIDPSWRWIMLDEFGQLVRTIDGRALEFGYDGAWLPETGQYSGTGPGPELAFRVGTDVWAVPEFDAEQLAPWLERADLVEAFLAGKPIDKPSITSGEVALLRAKAQADAEAKSKPKAKK